MIKILNYKKYITKRYKHIDKPKNIRKVESYVTDKHNISQHSFLPFIKNNHEVEKWQRKKHEKNGYINIKERRIMYAGHLDNYIYRYYSDQLNCKYNTYLEKNELDEVVLAYRSNKLNQSNINFSAKVINEIVEHKEAYILIGDFTDFFNKIDHSKLKENIQKVINTDRLCKDWFNIYKSATKYGYYEKEFLEDAESIIRDFDNISNDYSYFSSVKSFRKFQRKYPCKFNTTKFGIPQGLAISGVFSNIACLDFDQSMKDISDQNNGIYRRYSDDFIIALPKSTNLNDEKDKIPLLKNDIISLAESNGMELNPEKTNIYEYTDNKIINFETKEQTTLDYLGFIFNGEQVSMRGKSVYKYYRKAYQAIDIAKQVKKRKELNQIPYKREIYRLYTDYGTDESEYGNFMSYAKRSQRIFDGISPRTKNMMENQIKNRQKKLLKHLHKKD